MCRCSYFNLLISYRYYGYEYIVDLRICIEYEYRFMGTYMDVIDMAEKTN